MDSTIPITYTPPIKFAGGKRWLTSRLRELYAPHRHRRLVEPFVGGMSVSLALQPERALLADAMIGVVAFWQRVRKPRPFSIEMVNSEASYYAHRERFNQLVQTGAFNAECGELFYYLNRTCFNGLVRVNKKGEFNVPFGRYKSIEYRRDFSDFAEVLANWQIEHCRFQDLVVDDEDFVYIDPPYDDGFVAYTAEGFDWAAQVALAEKFAKHPGPVAASNLATKRIVELYRDAGYRVTYIDAPRRISSDGNRERVSEMLAFRNLDYRAPDAVEGQTVLPGVEV